MSRKIGTAPGVTIGHLAISVGALFWYVTRSAEAAHGLVDRSFLDAFLEGVTTLLLLPLAGPLMRVNIGLFRGASGYVVLFFNSLSWGLLAALFVWRLRRP